MRIGFNTNPIEHRVSQCSAQHHGALTYITYRYLYFLSLRFFFVSLKQSYVKRQLLEIIRYTPSIRKMIRQSAFPHRPTFANNPLSFSFSSFVSLSFSPFSSSSSPCRLHPKREMQVELCKFSKFSA